MKNVIKSLFACAAVALLITSCSKETNCVNNITGTWTIATMTAVDTAGNEVNLLDNGGVTSTGTIEATKYNTASADERGLFILSLTSSIGGVSNTTTDTTEYIISEDCGQLWAYDSIGAASYQVITINELTNSSASFSIEEDDVTTTITTTK